MLRQKGLTRCNRLYNHLLHPLPQLVRIVPILRQLLPKPFYAPLMSAFLFPFAKVLFKVVRSLVYGIIRQVHEELLYVFFLGALVGNCGEAYESVLVDKQSHWIDVGNEDIDSEIELKTFN